MTRYFYDTEFLEDGRTIELISIGIVADDGRELYLINRDFRWRRIAGRRWYAPWSWKVRHQWLLDNVVTGLPTLHGDARLHYGRSHPFGLIDWQHPSFRTGEAIAQRVREFLLGGDDQVELCASYSAYDHVALCQLFGTMMDLPPGIPMWTHDLCQVIEQLPAALPLPEQADGLHNALADARHAKALFEFTTAQTAGGPE